MLSSKENPVAIQSEIDEQVTALKAVKEGLKETNPSLNLKEGVYTADSRIVETDGTLDIIRDLQEKHELQ